MSPADPSLPRTGSTWRLIFRELRAFGTVGAVCLVVDLLLFQLLYSLVGVDAVPSKLLATLASMSLAFLGHRYWSFADRAWRGMRRESLLFAVVNGLTLLLGLAVIAFVRYPLGQESGLVLQGANVLAIGGGTVIRFLAYRRWVFTEPRPAPAPAVRPLPVGGSRI